MGCLRKDYQSLISKYPSSPDLEMPCSLLLERECFTRPVAMDNFFDPCQAQPMLQSSSGWDRCGLEGLDLPLIISAAMIRWLLAASLAISPGGVGHKSLDLIERDGTACTKITLSRQSRVRESRI